MTKNIGPRYYSLLSLFRYPPREWADFVREADSNKLLRKINPLAAQWLVTDKVAFYGRVESACLPTIPILCVIGEDVANLGSRPPFCSSASDFVDVLDGAPEEIFFKPVNGSHGTGAFSASKVNRIWQFDGTEGSGADLFLYCKSKLDSRQNWLVQPKVRPHDELLRLLSPNALCTVRVITAMFGGRAEAVLAVLRIPVGGNSTDNFSEGAAGNLAAPVDLESGVLGEGVMSKVKRWPNIVTMDFHPDTGRRIRGYKLPLWEETLRLTLKAQEQLHEAPTLGWDIAITDDGPVIVEANAGYGVNILQVAHQRGLRRELAPIYALAPME